MAKNTAAGCGTILVVALMVGGCMTVTNAIFGGDDEPAAAQPAKPVELPNWAKKPLVEAENEAKALGLDMSSGGMVGGYCADETDCFVYKTTPAAGTVVRAGAKVAVKFVTGEEWAFYKKHRKMPNMVGWSEERADKLLEPIYWVADSTRKETSSIPVGAHRVLSQSPKAGKPLRIGQEVKLVIGVNYGTTTSGGGGGGDVDINVGNGGGESRFCSGRWWC